MLGAMTMSPTTAARPATAARPPGFGAMLREWRQVRGSSQLDLALDCGVSQRHLSFLESGRARPSRGMVQHLAAALAVPLREQNAMLLAAGFAPAFPQRAPSAPALRPVEEALTRVLAQQEPYPALVVDEAYTVHRANGGAARLVGLFADVAPGFAEPMPNLLDVLLRPDGLKPYVEDWRDLAIWLLRRARAEGVLAGGRPADRERWAALMALPEIARLAAEPEELADPAPALTVRLHRGEVRLALFSMIATIGTPLDVGLESIRVELFFPADEATDRWFRADPGPAV